MQARRFTAEGHQGHSECAVRVPFEPASVWEGATPRRIGYGKHMGCAVQGSVRGEAFENSIRLHVHEWRMVVPEDADERPDARSPTLAAAAFRVRSAVTLV